MLARSVQSFRRLLDRKEQTDKQSIDKESGINKFEMNSSEQRILLFCCFKKVLIIKI